MSAPLSDPSAVADRLSRIVAGNNNLVQQPGVVQGLLEAGASAPQAQAVDQFIGGLNAELKVRTAAAAGIRVPLSPTETTALDAMGINYSGVQLKQQQAIDQLRQSMAGAGREPIIGPDGLPELDSGGNPLSRPIPKPKPKPAAPKPSGGGGFFGAIAAPFKAVGNLVMHGQLTPDYNAHSALSYLGRDAGAVGALHLANDAYQVVSTELSNVGQARNPAQFAAASTQNADLARQLGYDPNSTFSMAAFEARGYAHHDLTPLAQEWDTKHPDGLFGWTGQQAVNEAEQFAIDPEKYRQNILNSTTNDQQAAERLQEAGSPEFQDLVRKVQARKSDVGTDTATAAGIDPVKHPTLFGLTSAATNVVASFALDPLAFSMKAAQAGRIASVAVPNLADGEAVRSVLLAEDGIKSMAQASQIAHVKNLVQAANDFREASGDAVRQAQIVARLTAGNPYAPLLQDFVGTSQILRRTDEGAVIGAGEPIDTFEKAVDYIASRDALTRLSGGIAPVQSTMLPGALSSYGFLKLKGSLAAWSAGRTAGRATQAASDYLGWASADPARFEQAVKDGYIAKFDPQVDDAIDPSTGKPIYEANSEVTQAGMGALRRGELTYGSRGTSDQMSAVGKVVGYPTLGVAARARLAIQRMTNALPRVRHVNVDSAASLDTLDKIARTYLTIGDAALLKARWIAGDDTTRKTILEGLKDQIAEAAGLSKTSSFRWMKGLNEERQALVSGWKTDTQKYNTLGDDYEWTDRNGVPGAQWPGQVQKDFYLPDFSKVHHAAVKVGLYEATLGRVLTSHALDKLMTQWKIGALMRPITATRAVIESWINAANEGLFGTALGTKALLRDSGRLYDGDLARMPKVDRILSFIPSIGASRLYRHVLESTMDGATADAVANMPEDLLHSAIHEQSAFHQAMDLDPGGTSSITRGAELGLKPGRITYDPRYAWTPKLRARQGFQITEDLDGIKGADAYANALATRMNQEPEVARAVLEHLTGRDLDQAGTLYHGGLPHDATLDDIDLEHLGAQQNKSGKDYGGFYLSDSSSRRVAENYAATRSAALHRFRLRPDARMGDMGDRNIDRLSAYERRDLAERYDYIKGKDAFGRTQYTLLNKNAVASMQSVGQGHPIEDVIKALDESPAMRHTMYGKYFKLDGGTTVRAALPDEIGYGKRQWAQNIVADMEQLVTGRNGHPAQQIIDYFAEHGKAPSADWILDNVKNMERPNKVLAPTFIDLPSTPGVQGMLKNIFELESRGYQRLVEIPIQRHATAPLFTAAYAQAKVGLEALKARWIEEGISEPAAERMTAEIAAGQGWARVARMLDDPHMKMQMDIVGRGFFAFSRATTMMLRRWGSTFWRNPAAARRMQLAAEGAVQSGVVYKDENGQWVFNFPLSGVALEVLQHAMSVIPGLHDMISFPVQDLRGQVGTIIPGSNNPLQYSTSPMVSLTGRWIASHFPEHREWFDEIDKRLNGSLGQGRGVIDTLTPSLLKSLMIDPQIWPFTSDDHRNTMVASAMVGSLYNLYAAGMVPKESASADEWNQFFERLRKGVLSQLFIRGAFGSIEPAILDTPEAMTSAAQPDFAYRVTGARDLRAEFKELLNDTGGDFARANAIWARLHPDELVYTQSGSQSTTAKALLAATDQAYKWLSTNQGFVSKYKSVAAYFVPQAASNAPFSMTAYRAELEQGLRERKTPDEFLNGVYVSQDSSKYFAMEDKYKADYAIALGQSPDAATAVKTKWLSDSAAFKATHPLFKNWLEDHSLGGQTAVGQLASLRNMVNNHDVPLDKNSSQTLANMIQAFDGYETFVRNHQGQKSDMRAARSQALSMLQDYLAGAVKEAPDLVDVYNGVFRVLNTNLDTISQ